jgi:hypothetical protein
MAFAPDDYVKHMSRRDLVEVFGNRRLFVGDNPALLKRCLLIFVGKMVSDVPNDFEIMELVVRNNAECE